MAVHPEVSVDPMRATRLGLFQRFPSRPAARIPLWIVSVLMAVMGTAAPVAQGQTIRGEVIDESAGFSVTRAFVSLLDERGVELVRSLTDDRGQFVLHAPGPGVYRLRSKRIGFRETVSDSFHLTEGQTRHLRLMVESLPVPLPSVVVEGEPRCGVAGERGSMAARLWEEIREALAAVTWTAGRQLYRYSVIRYQRDLAPIGRRVIAERTSSWSGYSVTPFRSAPAEDLARHGYVVASPDSVTYFAPDAAVLVSQPFVATHCFSVTTSSPKGEEEVGLRFWPAPGRTQVEVEGILWVDRQSLELRRLEYLYTNLPADLPEGYLGGQVEFLRLPSGAWIVHRWNILMPQLERVVFLLSTREPETRLRGYRESGGRVLEVTTSGGDVVFAAQHAVVEGVVFDSARGEPLEKAQVFVVGTPYSTATDAAGYFFLSVPLSGTYDLAFRHPRLDSVGARETEVTVSVSLTSGERVRQLLALPAEETLLMKHCGDTPVDSISRVVLGVVRDASRGQPIHGARVVAAWQDIRAPMRRVEVRERRAHAVSDRSGFYSLCGVPLTRLITLSAQTDEAWSRTVTLSFREDGLFIGDGPFRTFHGRIWKQDFELERSISGLAVISALIRDDATKKPLPGARVSLLGLDASGVSDSTGRVQVGEVPAGLYTLVVSREGYESLEYSLEVNWNDTLDIAAGVLDLRPLPREMPRPPELEHVQIAPYRHRTVVAGLADLLEQTRRRLAPQQQMSEH
ncbi:hypothetical protein HRbin33_00324 [bacterium HR33]|nr:hypothetical protein HRbin33_00324 [bacterium HR33]